MHMNLDIRSAACATLAGLLASTALAHHHHVTVRTPTGAPGEALQLVVGYLEDEADLSIDPVTGQILDGSEIFVVELPILIDRGDLAGYFTGEGISLTSDFFAGDGLLDGSDIFYEMVAVVPVEGPEAQGAWCTTDEESGELNIEALSSAETREDRSLHVGVGGHPHGQLVGVTQEGEYDVVLVAWDASGLFLDSPPAILRVHAHLPSSDLNGDGLVDGSDLGILLAAWGTHEADLNGDETTDGADLGIMLSDWS